MPDREITLAAFDHALAAHGDLSRKGKAMPYAALNGNMFAFVSPENILCFRLPPDLRAAFNAQFGGGPVEQHGRVMKDYVAAPAEILADHGALDHWFGHSVAFARGLKPKATRR